MCDPSRFGSWSGERGEGLLLLGNGEAERLSAGDVVRTPAGETHGVEDTGAVPLVYLAVTTPPQDFIYSYSSTRSTGGS